MNTSLLFTIAALLVSAHTIDCSSDAKVVRRKRAPQATINPEIQAAANAREEVRLKYLEQLSHNHFYNHFKRPYCAFSYGDRPTKPRYSDLKQLMDEVTPEHLRTTFNNRETSAQKKADNSCWQGISACSNCAGTVGCIPLICSLAITCPPTLACLPLLKAAAPVACYLCALAPDIYFRSLEAESCSASQKIDSPSSPKMCE